MPEDTQKQAIQDIAKAVPDADREIQQGMILAVRVLLERKEKYFGDNKRFIVDYQITESDHRINLNVVSTVAKDDTHDT